MTLQQYITTITFFYIIIIFLIVFVTSNGNDFVALIFYALYNVIGQLILSNNILPSIIME